ncbi:MAG TPA: response regulator transcription factor [Acidimicrobiales bacterium]|nr:response regulator transcription factor [Acidimicrobiales bacterium]
MIRIVVVDDHEMVRAGLRVMLETEPDFEVVGEAGSADRLHVLVERTKPDVVLLDARLPGVSGPDATRRLAESHPDVRVIIVTTYSDDELVDASIDAGARGFVVKDVERFTLKQSIRAVYRGEAVIDSSVAGRLLERVRRGGAQDEGRPALNPTQHQILRLISEGFSNREIAERVHLSENTVKSHVQEIFRKLDVRNRVEAALRAVQDGWV